MEFKNRVKELRMVKGSELHPHPRNWRKHPEKQLKALRGLLGEVGFAGAELARELEDGTLQLIDGHARASMVGDSEIPVLILDVDESEADKILATFDPIGAMAETNKKNLDSILRQIQTSDEEVAKLLSDIAADAGLYLGEDAELLTDPDDVPDVPEDPITKVGDLWMLGRHRLLCGDSTEIDDIKKVMLGKTADICFTSPPYGLGKSVSLSGNKAMSKKDNAYDLHHDDASTWPKLMREWFESSFSAVSDCWIINVQPLAGNKRELFKFIVENIDYLCDVITWDKGHGAPQIAQGVMASRFEWMLIFSKKKNASRAVPKSSWQGTLQNVYIGDPQRNNEYSSIHAATMPLHLPIWVMDKLCDLAVTVYEPFAGTGTTLIAAEQLGRTCYGIELSPRYCDVIVERWQNLTGEKAHRENGTA